MIKSFISLFFFLGLISTLGYAEVVIPKWMAAELCIEESKTFDMKECEDFADMDSEFANFYLGQYYEKRSPRKAINFYERALELGSHEAKPRIERLREITQPINSIWSYLIKLLLLVVLSPIIVGIFHKESPEVLAQRVVLIFPVMVAYLVYIKGVSSSDNGQYLYPFYHQYLPDMNFSILHAMIFSTLYSFIYVNFWMLKKQRILVIVSALIWFPYILFMSFLALYMGAMYQGF